MSDSVAEAEALIDVLVAGAEFDIIHSVFKRCPDWGEETYNAMIAEIVERLAARWGIIDDEAQE